MKLILALLSLSLAVFTEAHICFISPRQRAPLVDVLTSGNEVCGLQTAPCGGIPRGQVTARIRTGETVPVILQKNLNHFHEASPGFFQISIGPNARNLRVMATIRDTDHPALTLYSVNVTMPLAHGYMVLQAVYDPKNPNINSPFYQCADVFLVD